MLSMRATLWLTKALCWSRAGLVHLPSEEAVQGCLFNISGLQAKSQSGWATRLAVWASMVGMPAPGFLVTGGQRPTIDAALGINHVYDMPPLLDKNAPPPTPFVGALSEDGASYAIFAGLDASDTSRCPCSGAVVLPGNCCVGVASAVHMSK